MKHSDKPRVWVPRAGFFEELQRVLGVESMHTKRIVIDFNMNNIPAVYIECHGDERMLDILPTLEGIQLRVIPVKEMPDER